MNDAKLAVTALFPGASVQPGCKIRCEMATYLISQGFMGHAALASTVNDQSFDQYMVAMSSRC